MSSLPSYSASLATSLQPFPYTSSSSASAYPTLVSTTSSGFHNTKTSRIMSNLNSISSSSSIHPISPTLSTPTAHVLHTTFRGSGSSSYRFTGTHQTSTTTTMGLSSSALPSFKNFMKSSTTHSSSSSSSGIGGKQQFPPDFTFSKNHWTNSGKWNWLEDCGLWAKLKYLKCGGDRFLVAFCVCLRDAIYFPGTP